LAGNPKQGGWGEIPQFHGFVQVKLTLILIRYGPYEYDYEYEQNEAAGFAEPAALRLRSG
jgi:hypothetical protein